MESSKEARHASKAAQRERKRAAKAAHEEEGRRRAAVYEREDSVGANQEARRFLAEHPPVLDELQSELVGRLRADGIATVEFAQLFSADLWTGLASYAATFVGDVERRLGTDSDGDARTRVKKGGTEGFIQRRYGKDRKLEADDPWLRLALTPRLLDVVNAYLGLAAKLTYCDQWYTVPVPAGAERNASQNWHRDHVDRHLVKVFVYLSDVDAGAGPFEYVAGSTGDGPFASLWAWAPGIDHYPPTDAFDERIPESAIRTLTGPAGTMVLCNTSGFHRGGYATERPRILWRFNYSSPASLAIANRRFEVDLSELDEISDTTRFALT